MGEFDGFGLKWYILFLYVFYCLEVSYMVSFGYMEIGKCIIVKCQVGMK